MPGWHPAILPDEEYADAVAGVEARKRHIGAKPTFARRTYALPRAGPLLVQGQDARRHPHQSRQGLVRSEVEADLLAIPGDAEMVVLFDRHRLVIQSLGDQLAATTPEAIQSIVALLVERVGTRDRQVIGWVPTGPAEPFFDSALPSPWRSRRVVGERASHDALTWYAGEVA